VRVGRDVRLLHGVLRLDVVAQDGARDAEQALVVAAHDQLEQRRLAVADATHDGLVGKLVHPHHSIDARRDKRLPRGNLGARSASLTAHQIDVDPRSWA